ncbi:MAG: 50S ribosomal protein L35 [Chloroflexi bacterium]|nr:50S ribosomal protein L35 [Chloroflexota bacterium]MYE45585.1 50S ribosomal protein L35 [Chloroflexota bacterium]
MPKMKTHRGTAKRVKVTGSGKLLVRAHHLNNKRMKKRREKLQALGRMHEVDETQRKRIRTLLGR